MELIGKISKRKPKPKPPIVITIGEALAFDNPVLALWPALVNAVNFAEDRTELVYLSKPASTLYLIDIVHREVQNGGFHQFFYNTSGRLTLQTLAALEEVGALVFADILRRAIFLFPNTIVPVGDQLRREALQGFSEELERHLSKLDDEFNLKICFSQERLPDCENQYFLALNFIEKYRESPVKRIPPP